MPRSGVTYAPEAHWHLAGIWANYKPEEFFALEGDDQARVVALYDLHTQVEAVIENERARKMRQQMKSKGT